MMSISPDYEAFLGRVNERFATHADNGQTRGCIAALALPAVILTGGLLNGRLC
jgi:hypothetical protein